MEKLPETIANAQRMKARHPWLAPSHLEAFADPEIFSKRLWDRVIDDNHGHNNPICVEAPDGRPGLWFPDKSYRYSPQADATTDRPLDWIQRLRWSEFMRELYKLLDRDEWERVVLRFGPYSEGDFLVVGISSNGLTLEHWHSACALAQAIATRPEIPPSPEKADFEPF